MDNVNDFEDVDNSEPESENVRGGMLPTGWRATSSLKTNKRRDSVGFETFLDLVYPAPLLFRESENRLFRYLHPGYPLEDFYNSRVVFRLVPLFARIEKQVSDYSDGGQGRSN
jgi:hypothetical protein